MNNAGKTCYFILSCARSGSTSLCRILDRATNGVCVMEPIPNLNVESRDAMDDRCGDLSAIVDEQIVPRVRKGLEEWTVYGEKNVTYAPFIPELYDRLDCRFVFLKRDGRDVVRSLLDWHNRKFGTIYRECRETSDVTDTAFGSAAALYAHEDTSDYSRPRPSPDDPLFAEWEGLSRLEMCAYYWQRINQLYLEQLKKIPAFAWISIDYTDPCADDILRVVDFLGLKGLSREKIGELLAVRINSLSERGITDGAPVLPWSQWPDDWRDRFDRIADAAMVRLGYYEEKEEDTRIEDSSSVHSISDQSGQGDDRFGEFWRTHDGGISWYRWMYDYRVRQHKALELWFAAVNMREPLESVVDFGCGAAVGYPDFFKDIRYVGIDLAEPIIQWCLEHNTNSHHDYWVREFIESPPEKEFDLVMSQGTIDNVYDMDAFLRAAIRASKKWIYINAYRGFFKELDNHVYRFNEEQNIYYNDLSPSRAYETLRDAGCRDISIHPSPTGYDEIPFETVIIAHV